MATNVEGHKGPTVLVIDDEEVIRELLVQFLGDNACEVVATDAPEHALGLLPDNRFDVALVDYTLPAMDGIEVCRRIVAHSPSTRCVLITGWGDLDRAEREASISKIVAKPFDLGAMLALVRALSEAPEEKETEP